MDSNPGNTPGNGKQPPTPTPPRPGQPARSPMSSTVMIALLVLAIGAAMVWSYYSGQRWQQAKITYSFFIEQLGTSKETCRIEKVTLEGLRVYGEFKTPPPLRPVEPKKGDDAAKKAAAPAANPEKTEPQATAATEKEKEEAAKKADAVGSSRVDLQACKLEYSIVSPK